MPVLAVAAEKHTEKLEEDDELQLASACGDAGAVRSGTPIDPELKLQEATAIPKAPVAESASGIAEDTCAPVGEVLQPVKRTSNDGLTIHDAANNNIDVPILLDDNDVDDFENKIA